MVHLASASTVKSRNKDIQKSKNSCFVLKFHWDDFCIALDVATSDYLVVFVADKTNTFEMQINHGRYKNKSCRSPNCIIGPLSVKVRNRSRPMQANDRWRALVKAHNLWLPEERIHCCSLTDLQWSPLWHWVSGGECNINLFDTYWNFFLYLYNLQAVPNFTFF